MKFQWRHGLIWVEIEIIYAGQRLKIDNCIVDTGSATTAVDINDIDFNYRKDSSIRRLFGVGGGTQEVIAQNVDKLYIDQQVVNDIEIGFGDLNQNLGINGFIGTDVLSQFQLKLDFVKQTIVLSPLST